MAGWKPHSDSLWRTGACNRGQGERSIHVSSFSRSKFTFFVDLAIQSKLFPEVDGQFSHDRQLANADSPRTNTRFIPSGLLQLSLSERHG